MEFIPITKSKHVKVTPHHWQIWHETNEGQSADLLTEATPQKIVLPTKTLSVLMVEEICLGWVPEQKVWQLGLFVRESDSLIWHQLAQWHELETAKQAGEALSRLIKRPFGYIGGEVAQLNEVSQDTQPSSETMPTSSPAVTVPPPQRLPIMMGDWILRPSAQGIIWQLTGAWQFRHLLRVGFFIISSIIFVALGIGTLNSGLAPVTPEFLPWVAFIVAFILLYSAAENLWAVVMRHQIVVDDERQEIRCERAFTGLVTWRLPYDTIEYLLVSQEPANPQGRRARQDPMRIAQDAWVHLCTRDQDFYLLAELNEVEGQSWTWETIRKREAKTPRLALSLGEYDTPLHHAVMQMAQRIAVSAYVDIR